MLLSFTLENWMSFRDPVKFSMIATRERQHGKRLSRLDKFQKRVLPIAAIYGGNASGKTNFFKALNFAKSLIVKGTQPDSRIAVEPYRLDPAMIDRPSRFSFELLIDEIVYEFEFSVTRKEVVGERLSRITSTSEKVLYDRMKGADSIDQPKLDRDFLKFAFHGTRDNQLFLTNSVSQKQDNFRPVYNWFRDTLELIAPDTRFEPFEHFIDEKHPLYDMMNNVLQQLDTGIVHLGGEKIPFESIPIPEALKNQLQEEMQEGMTGRLLLNEPVNERIIISMENEEVVAKKLVTYHDKADGGEARFEMRQESDGSQRVIDLLPAILELSMPLANKVFVIDEMDRSLHTILIRRLLEFYLATCIAGKRSQLLLTTHDVLLMDQSLFRRDEMWVTERNPSGSTDLFSFSDYSGVRYDSDLRKMYLQGRFGGIPQILVGDALADQAAADMGERE